MIRFTPSPENEIVWNELNQFIEKISNPSRDAVTSIANIVRWGFGENFADERAGDGGAWEPLSPRTVRERIADGFPGDHPILKRTGSYFDSFTNPSNPDHIEEVETTASGWSVQVGSQDDRVDILEYGGWNGQGFVPPRPVLNLGAEQEYVLGTTLDEFFTNLA